MSQLLPLLRCWSISAPVLPEELLVPANAQSFSLPGAEDLSAFADLLSDEHADAPEQENSAPPSVPFALPALIPASLEGAFSLSCSIDFGALCGDRAILTIDHISGCGRILLGEAQLAAFDTSSSSYRTISEAADMTAAPCMLAVDLTDALMRGRKETLTICFDDARPAGISGAAMLRVSSRAFLSRVNIQPDAQRRTMTVCAQINAFIRGKYALRVQPVGAAGTGLDVRESAYFCQEASSCEAEITLSVPGERFATGRPAAPQSMKITLVQRGEDGARDTLCDRVTLLCGYPGAAPLYALPLTAGECMLAPDELMQKLRSLHIPAVRLPVPAPDALYRALTREGISALMNDNIPLRARLQRYPCAAFAAERIGAYSPVSPVASAWQMDSMVHLPRTVDPLMTDAELLAEAAGSPLSPDDPHVQDILLWLRAVSVRMRAEAARQGRFSGALCTPGERNQNDVSDALRTAFAPTHLSALPLCGAWWICSRFSASVHAFLPEGRYGREDPLVAQVFLEDEEGQRLAQLRAPCRSAGGYVGLIEAVLPDHPCVLTLHTQLTLHDEVLEQTTLPVYVGERGALEAAFR